MLHIFAMPGSSTVFCLTSYSIQGMPSALPPRSSCPVPNVLDNMSTFAGSETSMYGAVKNFERL